MDSADRGGAENRQTDCNCSRRAALFRSEQRYYTTREARVQDRAAVAGGAQGETWVAHASRVLVSASRRNNLSLSLTPQRRYLLTGKFAIAGRARQHARRVRYPESSALSRCCKRAVTRSSSCSGRVLRIRR